VRIRLDDVEAGVLGAMLADIADVVESDAFAENDPVRARLFPAGYRDDAAAADDFRDLTERSLRVERAQRARECADEIHGGGEITLDGDAGERWIQVINDLRLALGTRLEITDEDGAHEIDADDPRSEQWAIYHWLTALQDGIVTKLMR
jgi:hypothetical protein